MIARLSAFLVTRSARERWLLALVPVVVLPLGFGVLVALPLLEHRAAARAELAEALATRDWYQARQAEIAGLPLPAAAPEPGAVTPVGLSGIEDSLIAAGLRERIAMLANAQGDAVSMALRAVPFESLMAWIDTIRQTGGYRLTALQITRADTDGFVDAQLQLAPGP